MTDADGKPVLTSIVTMLGEAPIRDEADEVARRSPRGAMPRSRSSLLGKTQRSDGSAQPKNMFRRLASS